MSQVERYLGIQNLVSLIFVDFLGFADYGQGLVHSETLLRGPSMTSDPVSVVVLSGGYDVYFECVATGNPTVNYTWTKDNNRISAATDSRYGIGKLCLKPRM